MAALGKYHPRSFCVGSFMHYDYIYDWLGDFWMLLGAVLLMRSGILRKGLPAQWLIRVEAQYRGESPFIFNYTFMAFS